MSLSMCLFRYCGLPAGGQPSFLFGDAELLHTRGVESRRTQRYALNDHGSVPNKPGTRFLKCYQRSSETLKKRLFTHMIQNLFNSQILL